MSIFSIYWGVGNVQHTKEFSTRRNIKKQVLFPRYQGSVGLFDTVSAYVGSLEIDPPSNLNIIRAEDSISENSRSAFLGGTVWTGGTGYASARYFLLTDIVGDYVSQSPEPFYLKHILPSASIDPESVAILDADLQEVNSYSYLAVRTEARDSNDIVISGTYESCEVFSNYSNSYNKETGEIEIYYVRYSASGTTHYQILNSQPAFSEATVDDISLVTGRLKIWRKVYILSVGPSQFTIKTPQNTTDYYLTPLESSRIQIKEPVDRSDQSPWFLSVSNGSFSILRNDLPYTFSVPEFSLQTFSPLYPYKLEVDELAEQLSQDLLKVDRTPMQVSSSLYEMSILVKNAQGNVLYAFTTNSSKDGTYYEEVGNRVYRTIETDNAWITWDVAGISAWDAEGGFIHLQREHPDTHYFYVTYYYREDNYEVTSLNVNPIFDEEYNNQFYVLYIVPIGGSNDNIGQTRALQYLKVDRSGRIVEASQDGTGGNLDIATNINVEQQYMYYSKSVSTTSSIVNDAGQNYVDLLSTSSFPSSGILVWENSSENLEYQAFDSISGNRISFESYLLTEDIPEGKVFRLHSFIDPYSTAENNSYQWLVLAEIYTSTTSRVDELSIIDLRMSGGVIKDKYKSDALAIDPRAIWARPEVITSRGQSIPGDSVAIVKIPYTILQEYGGNFTMEQVEAVITERHLATGVVPVVILHGAIPEITSSTSTASSVTVVWESEGSGYSYYIYYSSSKNGPWTLANSVPFSDQTYGNTYTISGLTSGLIYYVVVTSVNSDGIESPRGIPWGIKTRNS